MFCKGNIFLIFAYFDYNGINLYFCKKKNDKFMKSINLVFCLVVVLIYSSCTPNVNAPEPVYPIPDKKQEEWQELGMYAFIHFGMNTFTDDEWGYGETSPDTFMPSAIDCEQWVKTLKAAGMKGVILTAKHIDGFCLWPSKYTDYSVKSSSWMNGRGDVVKMLSDACKKYDLKFAVYLSPWDRSRSDFGTPAYLTYYQNQLREVLTNYGEVFEFWFDGGTNNVEGWYGGMRDKRSIDTRTYYDYPHTFALIESLQPNAVIFSDGGPGCRWVGNEKGYAGETNWSFLRKGVVYPGYPNYDELNTGHPDGDMWCPAECDVSMRPGWFYHKSQDCQVKTVDDLIELYYCSIGRNANLLLNFPVDQRGRIPFMDSLNAVHFYETICKIFSENILEGSKVTASNERNSKFQAKYVLKNDDDIYWATDDGVDSATVEFELPKIKKIGRVVLQEYIPLGQRVTSFSIEVKVSNGWFAVNSSDKMTTVGYKRIIRFSPVDTDCIRITFKNARGPLAISYIGAYE